MIVVARMVTVCFYKKMITEPAGRGRLGLPIVRRWYRGIVIRSSRRSRLRQYPLEVVESLRRRLLRHGRSAWGQLQEGVSGNAGDRLELPVV